MRVTEKVTVILRLQADLEITDDADKSKHSTNRCQREALAALGWTSQSIRLSCETMCVHYNKSCPALVQASDYGIKVTSTNTLRYKCQPAQDPWEILVLAHTCCLRSV